MVQREELAAADERHLLDVGVGVERPAVRVLQDVGREPVRAVVVDERGGEEVVDHRERVGGAEVAGLRLVRRVDDAVEVRGRVADELPRGGGPLLAV